MANRIPCPPLPSPPVVSYDAITINIVQLAHLLAVEEDEASALLIAKNEPAVIIIKQLCVFQFLRKLHIFCEDELAHW